MLDYCVFTNCGSREINEDYFSVAKKDNNGYCFTVADGLGGHAKGEVASKIAGETFKKSFLYEDFANSKEFFDFAFEETQEKIIKEQKSLGLINAMKTTVVSLVLNNKWVQWAHIGDSRLYVFDKNKIVERTLDHSVVQMLVLTGDVKEKDIRNHPDRNKLIRVVGNADDETIDDYGMSKKIALEKCQAFLLCTDGFWENINEKDMCKHLKKSANAKEWLKKMCGTVMVNGKGKEMDNNTAIAIFVH